MSDTPKLFRVTLEVGDLERATELYAALFGLDGRRYPGARHYFDCGGVIVAVLDVSRGGMPPTPGPRWSQRRTVAFSRPPTAASPGAAASPLQEFRAAPF